MLARLDRHRRRARLSGHPTGRPRRARAQRSSTMSRTSPTSRCSTPCAAAARRDRIARQYASGFRDVFELGVPRLLACRAAGWPEPWAAGRGLSDPARRLSLTPTSCASTAIEWRALCSGSARGFNERLLAAARSSLTLAAELHNFDRRLKERADQPRDKRGSHRGHPFCRRACRRRWAVHELIELTQSSQSLS